MTDQKLSTQIHDLMEGVDAVAQPMSFIDALQDLLKQVSTDALRNTACIATFSSSRFGEEVKDSELGAELAANHGGETDMFKVNRRMFGGTCPELDQLVAATRAAYTKHRALTEPWKKRGGGLLPNARITEYLGVMGEMANKIADLREACRAALPAAHERAKSKLGTAYREADYRDLASIPDRFQVHFELEPIPDGVDLKLPDGYQSVQLNGLYDGVRARFARSIDVMMDKLERALRDATTKASNKDTKRWHKSLTENIVQRADSVVQFMESLGVFDGHEDGERMLSVLRDIREQFGQYDVKHIASSESYREQFRNASAIAHDSVQAIRGNRTDALAVDAAVREEFSRQRSEPSGPLFGGVPGIVTPAEQEALDYESDEDEYDGPELHGFDVFAEDDDDSDDYELPDISQSDATKSVLERLAGGHSVYPEQHTPRPMPFKTILKSTLPPMPAGTTTATGFDLPPDYDESDAITEGSMAREHEDRVLHDSQPAPSGWEAIDTSVEPELPVPQPEPVPAKPVGEMTLDEIMAALLK